METSRPVTNGAQMQRDLSALTDREYDLVIIGGGMFGACAAWDATLRGMSVALVEKGDFCGGTSANSFKIVHGGIRYLQHADLVRLWSSCRERSALLRIAPHLVQPLPIVIPTYGYGKQGQAFLGAGTLLYDLLTLDRNRDIRDPARHIPWTRFWNARRTLEEFPDLPSENLSGAAVFCDGQMYNPTRLVLAFLKSAVQRGAQMANYVEATRFAREDDCVRGVYVKDIRTGDELLIRSRAVLNAAGPWSERLLNRGRDSRAIEPGPYSRDACFVVRRQLSSAYALAVQGRTHDPDTLFSRPARHLFLVPWRGVTLVGVWHKVYTRCPDEVEVTADELRSFIEEVNWAYPALDITLNDVALWNAGLVPFGENEPGSEHLSYGKRSRLIDHEKADGMRCLVTLIGIRYTMGRSDAAAAVDIVCRKLGRSPIRPPTDRIPLYGGDIAEFGQIVREVVAAGVEPEAAEALAHNHGTAYGEILEHTHRDAGLLTRLPGSTVLEAEIVHAVRAEMALTLEDIVFRRTDLATGGHPGDAALERCAEIAAREIGWTPTQMRQEIARVLARFPNFNRSDTPTPLQEERK